MIFPPEARYNTLAGKYDNSQLGFDDPAYRIPDYDGMVFWNDVMQVTQTTSESLRDAQLAVIAGFTESAEWQSRIGDLDEAAFVMLLYTHIFGRAAEPAGHAYHLANLLSGAATREEMIRQFLMSPEAYWRFERHTYVTMAYVGLRRRAPERAGFVYHMQRMGAGGKNGDRHQFSPPDALASPSQSDSAFESSKLVSVTTFSAAKSSFDVVGLVRGIVYSPEYADRLAALGCFFPGGSPSAITITLPGGVPLEMVRIPTGSFQMGSNNKWFWVWCGDCETPIHTVNLGYDFYLGEYEVTQAQWEAVMGGDPSSFSGSPDNPVENVSWDDCQDFVEALNLLGQGAFRLPSEAEWEYACRAGTTTPFNFGASDCNPIGCHPCELDGHAWWCGNNSTVGTKAVGQKPPNAFGLYDMHGNVWEWCQDVWHESYNDPERPNDGGAWELPLGSERVVRGGSWLTPAGNCRSAARSKSEPERRTGMYGLRLVWIAG